MLAAVVARTRPGIGSYRRDLYHAAYTRARTGFEQRKRRTHVDGLEGLPRCLGDDADGVDHGIGVSSIATAALLARRRTGSAASAPNATSHWLWGERAMHRHRTDLRHTVTGYAIHHASSLFWATFHEAGSGHTRLPASRLAPGWWRCMRRLPGVWYWAAALRAGGTTPCMSPAEQAS